MTTNMNPQTQPPEHQAMLATDALLMGFYMDADFETSVAMVVVYHAIEDTVMEVLA